MLNTMEPSILVLPLKHSRLSSIPDHQTYGSPQKNADYPSLATSIVPSIPQNHPLSKRMVQNSKFNMVLVVSKDTGVLIMLTSVDQLLKTNNLVQSPNFKESPSQLPRWTVFWVWPSKASPSDKFPPFSKLYTNKERSMMSLSHST